MGRWLGGLSVIGLLAFGLSPPGQVPATASDTPPEQVGLVDTSSGKWYLRHPDGQTTSFFYGNPGDFPLMGDWNCDGIDTPAMYRVSTGFMYLRNSNTQGVGEISYFFGNPSDIPLAGDFDGDGCDTLAIYRPTEGQVYIKNSLGTGVADYSYYFGNPGDKPFAGDFNGDGMDTVGLHRESTGFLYFRNSNTQGVADFAFFYGNPGDRLFAGDWIGSGTQTFGVFRPSESRFYLRFSNTQGVADQQFVFGQGFWLPIAGNFGPLVPDAATTTTTLQGGTFGDGIWVVGPEVPPGTYRNSDSSAGCYWARLSGFGGTLDEIIANNFTYVRNIVTIESSDAGFESDDCGSWSNDLSPRTPSPTSPFDGGHFLVGTEVAAGTWRNSDSSGGCYWERLSGFSGELDDIISNSFSFDTQTVTISGTDVGFFSEDCGTWTKIG